MDEDFKKWYVQYRKGYIELCTLLCLKNESMHGLGILNFFEKKKLYINEGTLYPLLNRMEQNGLLDSTWDIPEQKGHPKKVYRISKKGENILPLMIESYDLHNESLKLIKGK